jgi:hypothetical protein
MTPLEKLAYIARTNPLEAMGRQAPAGLLGIHTNLPAVITNDVGAALGGGPTPAEFSEKRRRGNRRLEKGRPERTDHENASTLVRCYWALAGDWTTLPRSRQRSNPQGRHV